MYMLTSMLQDDQIKPLKNKRLQKCDPKHCHDIVYYVKVLHAMQSNPILLLSPINPLMAVWIVMSRRLQTVLSAKTLGSEEGDIVKLGPDSLNLIATSTGVRNNLNNVDAADISVGWRVRQWIVREGIQPSDGNLVAGVEYIEDDVRVGNRAKPPWEERTRGVLVGRHGSDKGKSIGECWNARECGIGLDFVSI
jgi:hypothetical protein